MRILNCNFRILSEQIGQVREDGSKSRKPQWNADLVPEEGVEPSRGVNPTGF